MLAALLQRTPNRYYNNLFACMLCLPVCCCYCMVSIFPSHFSSQLVEQKTKHYVGDVVLLEYESMSVGVLLPRCGSVAICCHCHIDFVWLVFSCQRWARKLVRLPVAMLSESLGSWGAKQRRSVWCVKIVCVCRVDCCCCLLCRMISLAWPLMDMNDLRSVPTSFAFPHSIRPPTSHLLQFDCWFLAILTDSVVATTVPFAITAVTTIVSLLPWMNKCVSLPVLSISIVPIYRVITVPYHSVLVASWSVHYHRVPITTTITVGVRVLEVWRSSVTWVWIHRDHFWHYRTDTYIDTRTTRFAVPLVLCVLLLLVRHIAYYISWVPL